MTHNHSFGTDYQINRLREEDLGQMHRSFQEAFSDYPVPYKLSLEDFIRKMRYKVHLDFKHSYGAFSGEKLVAFLFHSVNHYEKTVMAYNAGTGVIPGHRGRGLSLELYEAALPGLKASGIQKGVLEVLELNEKAINVYRQVGFETTKQFACFQLKHPLRSRTGDVRVISVDSTDFDDLSKFGELNPSFGDTFEQLKYNISFETTIHAYSGDQLVGYLIFQPKLARVTHFAVNKDFRGRGIGKALFLEAKEKTKKPLTVVNVNREYLDVIAFLEAIGFVHTLDQFEMQLTL